MSLINCPECGKEISDKAASCPNCGCPIQKQPTFTNSYGLFGSAAVCPKCKSQHIQMEVEELGYKTKGREETRKKSILTRTANSTGRAGMILATGGLWALTPKKSKYSTVKKSNTKAKKKKYFTCLDCGNSWMSPF